MVRVTFAGDGYSTGLYACLFCGELFTVHAEDPLLEAYRDNEFLGYVCECCLVGDINQLLLRQADELSKEAQMLRELASEIIEKPEHKEFERRQREIIEYINNAVSLELPF